MDLYNERCGMEQEGRARRRASPQASEGTGSQQGTVLAAGQLQLLTM